MSKTRWDRNRGARAQAAWDSDYFPMTGGLDRHSSGLTLKPGRIFQCLNFEEVFGYQGYSFIKGYERYDGYTTSPSRAVYYVIPFESGQTIGTMPAFSNTISNGGSVSCRYVTMFITSGSLAGGDAVGFVIFYGLFPTTSKWAAGDPIKFLGNTFATTSADSYQGNTGFIHNQDAMTTLREEYRALILKPREVTAGTDSGVGEILGGCIHAGVVWCVRDDASGISSTLYRSSGAGWFQVKTGLYPGAKCRFEMANFTGDPSKLKLYVVNGRDRLLEVDTDLVTCTKAAPIFGSEATSNSLVNLSATGSYTWTCAQASRSYQAGDAVRIQVIDDPSHVATGTVTSYNSGTGALVVNVTSISGSPINTDQWEINKSDFSDRPFLVREHKNHLFLGYPSGQLQTSNLGDPMVYTTTASLFGMGQELTGMSSLKGKALAVFCERKIDVIDGSSATDWDKQPYSKDYGAIIDTIVDNDGNPIFLSTIGLTTLAATQNFGNVEAKTFSRDVQDILAEKRSQVVGARMAFGNAQYRLYFSDGGCLRMTLLGGGGGSITEKSVSPTYSQYSATPSCLWQGMLVSGEERMFFGTTDGWVMEEDAGTSFDGASINYVLRLPYNHCKSPAVDKHFIKGELELKAPDAVTFNYRQMFDYDDGMSGYDFGDFSLSGIGGTFDVSALDNAIFGPAVQRAEFPIDGVGRNMATLLWATSDFVRPATLQGMLTFFNKLGVRP